MKIIIVGAGPAGLLLSILLRQQSFEVDIYDKRPSLELVDGKRKKSQGGRSVNVTLCARGLAALEIAGLSSQVHAMSVPVRGVVWHAELQEHAELAKHHELGELQLYGCSTLPLDDGDVTNNHTLLSIKRNDLTLLLETTAREQGVKLHFGEKMMSRK